MKKKENTDYLYDYVIYHRNCFDGFTGFFILTTSKRIHDNAMIFPDIPSAKEIPPNIEGKNIIIIDVAYKSEILKQIMGKARKVTFIDHHVSIRDDVMNLKPVYPHEVVYDEKMSGASLTWQYLFNSKKMPEFVRYIEDNDIGAWKLRYSRQFIMALEVDYKLEPTRENVQAWHKLFNKSEVSRLVKKGKIYSEYHEHLLDQNVRRYTLEQFPSEKIFKEYPSYFKEPGQYKVAVYNGSGCPTGSSLGAKLMEKVECDFALMWTYHMDKKEYVMSMRSNEEKNTDVGQIAKIFNGGGHRLASACSFPATKYNMTDLFYPNSLPRANKK
jgi:oligoribonuclease NrnB/cAMP/cGMP phosphodiesterase (DHH superfamily)